MSEAFILHFYIKENSLVMVYLKILEKHISFINKVNLQDGRSICLRKKWSERFVVYAVLFSSIWNIGFNNLWNIGFLEDFGRIIFLCSFFFFQFSCSVLIHCILCL